MDHSAADLELLVQELRKRVIETKMSGSIVPRTDDDFLAKFIRVKDFDLGKAFKSIKKYYECIHKYAEYHTGMKPSHYAYAYESKAYSLFKHRFNGVLTGVIRMGLWEPKLFPLLDCQSAAIFGAEEYLSQVEVQLNGVCLIVDYKGARFEHLWHATVKEIRRCAEVCLHGLPMRIDSIHILHPPNIFWPFFYLGRRFLKQKILKRVHFHADLESLHKSFNKEFLPDFLGGDLGEDVASETHLIKQLLKEDIPYEDYWNGAIWNEKIIARPGTGCEP